MRATSTEEIYGEFAITYLTETVNMDPTAPQPRVRGLVKYKVYAKNAEDAIRRLREQEPAEHPIIEIGDVVATGDDSTQLILPTEWGVAADINQRNGKVAH